MHLVLETCVLARRQQSAAPRDGVAERLDPAHLRLGEIAEHVGMDQLLGAGMADAEANALVIVADMGGDRAQAVVAGVAAADLDARLGGREVEFVVDDDDRATSSL